MKTMAGGFLLGAFAASLLWAFGPRHDAANAQPRDGFRRAAAGGGLIAMPITSDKGKQQIVVVQPDDQVIGVYGVDPASGGITLQSIRSIRWDLKMEEFNGGRPSPSEIRALLDQR